MDRSIQKMTPKLVTLGFFAGFASLSAGCIKSKSPPIPKSQSQHVAQVAKWHVVTFDPPRKPSDPIWASEQGFTPEVVDLLAKEQQLVAFDAYLNLCSTEAKSQIQIEMVEKNGGSRKTHFEAARAKGENGANNVVLSIAYAETNGDKDFAFVQISTQPFTGSLSEAQPFPHLRVESLVRDKNEGAWKFGGLLKSKDCPVAQFLFTLRPTEIAKHEATLNEKMNTLLQSE
jgi:hypothetical protein